MIVVLMRVDCDRVKSVGVGVAFVLADGKKMEHVAGGG